jgi:ribosomal protein L37AE/L43A
MVRKAVEPELNPHQKQATRERGEQETKFEYCLTCRRVTRMILNNGQWICSECGCPVKEA